MVNRPANANTAKKWDRAPQDWYRESPRVIQQLVHGLAAAGTHFGTDLIWDPCCGMGNVLDVMASYGHETIGSDVIDRHAKHRFIRGNVLQLSKMPRQPFSRFRGSPYRETSILSNTPYSYEPDIAERIITHCLETFPFRVAAFILPIAFLASQDRWAKSRLLRWKPSHACIYRERHTMPPGHLVDQMATPFEGGMADYCALVFTRPHRWRTELLWLPPGHFPDRPKGAKTKESE
jgi:hypothetical protein